MRITRLILIVQLLVGLVALVHAYNVWESAGRSNAYIASYAHALETAHSSPDSSRVPEVVGFSWQEFILVARHSALEFRNAGRDLLYCAVALSLFAVLGLSYACSKRDAGSAA